MFIGVLVIGSCAAPNLSFVYLCFFSFFFPSFSVPIDWFHVTSYNVANTSFRHFDSASRPATDRVSMSVSGDNHACRCDSWVYQQTRKRHRQKAGFTITADLPFWTAKVTIRETWVSREEDYGLEGSCQQKEQRSQTLVCSRHFVDGTWILLLLLGGGGGVLFVCLFLLGFLFVFWENQTYI